MECIHINPTRTTPAITLDCDKGEVKISGRSFPENPAEFYQPLFDWIAEYAESPQPKTSVIISVDYFTTSSSKCLLHAFKLLENIHIQGNDIDITWHYLEEDSDMKEAGEDYESILKVPFRLVSVEKFDFAP